MVATLHHFFQAPVAGHSHVYYFVMSLWISVRGFGEAISRGHRTKADYMDLIQTDFAQQTMRLIQTPTPER